MTIKQTIEKAIEGGWKKSQKAQFLMIRTDNHKIDAQIGDHFALDPSFWQSLGKAMGWDESTSYCKSGCGCKDDGIQSGNHEGSCIWEKCQPESIRYYWHRFIDHLAEGKSAEDYFKEL